MAARRVIWTEEAKAERREILRYWAIKNHSKTFAEKLFREFQHASRALREQPFMGKSTEVEDTRYIIVRHYAITYHVSENIIHIISVWDERRNPQTRPI